MSISNIQKEKFLDVIYKNLYSSGYIPKESEILDFFSRYFSNYTISQPLPMQGEIFRQLTGSNVDVLNQRMLHALFNIEVLYDALSENAEEMMGITNALNKRLQNLKARRTELENKIDDILFVNQNADAFFGAYTDSFPNTNGTDLSLTSAYVDVTNGKVTLPTLTSAVFDLVSAKSIIAKGATYSLSFNRTSVYSNQSLPEESFFPSVFDGLENTEWSRAYNFDSIGLVTFSLNLPIASNVVVSSISGRLNTISPADIYCRVNYSDVKKSAVTFSKKSSKDYDKFSFNFQAGDVGSIDIFLVKAEPDYIEENKRDKYVYRYGFRDISISGKYYERFASYVSKPISLKTRDNLDLAIDAVSISVNQSGFENGSIAYFIAEDNSSAESLSDFNWQPVSATNDPLASYPSVIKFEGSYLRSKKIVEKAQNLEAEIEKIPLASKSNVININQQNPTVDLYPNQLIYRVAKIDSFDEPYNSYILSGTGMVNGYYINYSNKIFNEINGLSTWDSIIGNRSSVRQLYTIPKYDISQNPTFFIGPNVSNISVLLETKLLCSKAKTIKHTFIKNDNVSKDWNVAVYVNGKPTYIPSGQFTETIEWNLKEGINSIRVAIDIEGSANGSITLMEGVKLSNYGSIYLDYYSYVDSLEFKKNRSIYDYVFTIENFFGNKEIMSRTDIRSNSKIFYFTNNPNKIESVRFRADLLRSQNPIGSPSMDSYTLKFKNSQQIQDEESSY